MRMQMVRDRKLVTLIIQTLLFESCGLGTERGGREVYRKFSENSGKKVARERDNDSKDVKTGTVIKDKNGNLLRTEKLC